KVQSPISGVVKFGATTYSGQGAPGPLPLPLHFTPVAVLAGNTGPASVQFNWEALYVKAPVAMLPLPCTELVGPTNRAPVGSAPTPVAGALASPGSPVKMPFCNIS